MKYKVILGFLILINIFTAVYPMIGKSKAEIHQGNESYDNRMNEPIDQVSEIEKMDKEIIKLFFIELIRSYINSYNDIFALYEGQLVRNLNYEHRFIYKYKVDKDLSNKMINLRLVCKKFRNVLQEYALDLEAIKSQLKKERFNYLREEIKSNYKDLTTYELDSKLAIILEKLEEDKDIETYKEGIRLVLSGADGVKIANKKGYNFLMYVSRCRLWMKLLTEIYPNLADWGISN